MPAHAEGNHIVERAVDGLAGHQAPLVAQPLPAHAADLGHSLASEARSSIQEAIAQQSGHLGRDLQFASDEHGDHAISAHGPPQVGDLLEGTPASHATGAESFAFAHAAPGISAEMLQSAIAGIAQHSAENAASQSGAGASAAAPGSHLPGELGRVLSDALGGEPGDRPDIDTLLSAAIKPGDPNGQIAHALASDLHSHEAYGYGHVDMHALMSISEAMGVHQLAAPAG
jgi:hypothetical protein